MAQSIDGDALARRAAKNGATFDVKRIADELAWQMPDDQGEKLKEDFLKLAAQRAGALDMKTIKSLVDQINVDRVENRLDKVTAHDKAVEMAGRGVVSWNVDPGWRWMFGATAAPACFFFVLMILVPESPRWLVKNGKPDRARKMLSRIGGPAYADCEVASVEETLVGEIEKVNFKDLLEPRMFKIIVLGVVLAVAQQWCGVNVLLYYATTIFQDAGSSVDTALFNIVIIGAVNLIFTAIALFIVDRLGRRILMLSGFAALAVSLGLIGIGFYFGYSSLVLLVFCLAAFGCFAMTLGPITWVLLSEIFPNRIRGAAMSISVFSLWAACFVLTYTFPLLRASLGKAGSFWIYAAISLAAFAFAYFNLPETKGKSLEQIEKELVD